MKKVRNLKRGGRVIINLHKTGADFIPHRNKGEYASENELLAYFLSNECAQETLAHMRQIKAKNISKF